jgi:hypothetical protein
MGGGECRDVRESLSRKHSIGTDTSNIAKGGAMRLRDSVGRRKFVCWKIHVCI